MEAEKINVDIKEMGLSEKSYGALKRFKVYNLAEIEKRNTKGLLKVKNVGKREIIEIMLKVKEYGLELDVVDGINDAKNVEIYLSKLKNQQKESKKDKKQQAHQQKNAEKPQNQGERAQNNSVQSQNLQKQSRYGEESPIAELIYDARLNRCFSMAGFETLGSLNRLIELFDFEGLTKIAGIEEEDANFIKNLYSKKGINIKKKENQAKY